MRPAPTSSRLPRRPGQGDVEQPPLLVAGHRRLGEDDGYEPVLEPDEADRRPLEPLGPVEGDQVHRILAPFCLIIPVRSRHRASAPPAAHARAHAGGRQGPGASGPGAVRWGMPAAASARRMTDN